MYSSTNKDYINCRASKSSSIPEAGQVNFKQTPTFFFTIFTSSCNTFFSATCWCTLSPQFFIKVSRTCKKQNKHLISWFWEHPQHAVAPKTNKPTFAAQIPGVKKGITASVLKRKDTAPSKKYKYTPTAAFDNSATSHQDHFWQKRKTNREGKELNLWTPICEAFL